MPTQSINPRERIRYDSDWYEGPNGTEYRCRHCGRWSHIDEWTCLGFTDEDVADLWPEFAPIYSGEDAICCPRCEKSQQTPGVLAVQKEMEFEL